MIDQKVEHWRPVLRVRASHDVQHRLEAHSGEVMEPDLKVRHLPTRGLQVSELDCRVAAR